MGPRKKSEDELYLVYRDTYMPKQRDQQYLPKPKFSPAPTSDNTATNTTKNTADNRRPTNSTANPGTKSAKKTTGQYNSNESKITGEQQRGVRPTTNRKVPHKCASRF